MNVKPGDLAYVVVPPGFSKLLAGKFLNVEHDGSIDDFYPGLSPAKIAKGVMNLRAAGKGVWYCTLHNPPQFEGQTIRRTYLLDSWLRPLRAPGDDAQDETLSWKPVPQTDEVPA